MGGCRALQLDAHNEALRLKVAKVDCRLPHHQLSRGRELADSESGLGRAGGRFVLLPLSLSLPSLSFVVCGQQIARVVAQPQAARKDLQQDAFWERLGLQS